MQHWSGRVCEINTCFRWGWLRLKTRPPAVTSDPDTLLSFTSTASVSTWSINHKNSARTNTTLGNSARFISNNIPFVSSKDFVSSKVFDCSQERGGLDNDNGFNLGSPALSSGCTIELSGPVPEILLKPAESLAPASEWGENVPRNLEVGGLILYGLGTIFI